MKSGSAIRYLPHFLLTTHDAHHEDDDMQRWRVHFRSIPYVGAGNGTRNDSEGRPPRGKAVGTSLTSLHSTPQQRTHLLHSRMPFLSPRASMPVGSEVITRSASETTPKKSRSKVIPKLATFFHRRSPRPGDESDATSPTTPDSQGIASPQSRSRSRGGGGAKSLFRRSRDPNALGAAAPTQAEPAADDTVSAGALSASHPAGRPAAAVNDFHLSHQSDESEERVPSFKLAIMWHGKKPAVDPTTKSPTADDNPWGLDECSGPGSRDMGGERESPSLSARSGARAPQRVPRLASFAKTTQFLVTTISKKPSASESESEPEDSEDGASGGSDADEEEMSRFQPRISLLYDPFIDYASKAKKTAAMSPLERLKEKNKKKKEEQNKRAPRNKGGPSAAT
jgi:hypothetical protein